jgi:hypothetical protein
MVIARRLLRGRALRAARIQGFETALGLADEPPPMRAAPAADLRCARCSGPARIETLDLRTSRGQARCGRCGQHWAVLYGS